MQQQQCASDDELGAFGEGTLPPHRHRWLLDHLDQCESCAARLESLGQTVDMPADQVGQGRQGELRLDGPMTQGREDQTLPSSHGPDSTLASFDVAADTSPHVAAHSSASSNADAPVPEIDGYRIVRVLGQGGMGVVYLAIEQELHRTVALKTIRAGQLADAEQVARFHREAEAAAALTHPNIVPVFQVGQSNGLHFFSMAYIEGQSLERLARSENLEVSRCVRIVQELAEAVHYAHERGVIHRDLKPDNVLIDQQQRPHITDFGLARRMEVEERLTLTGQVMGTVGYMSPEQAAGEPTGPSSDIYAVGAILYRLLAGKTPFGGGNLVSQLQNIVNKEPARPRSLRPGLDKDIETIILKAMSKSTTDRYATALEFAEDLRRYQNREPIQARPVGRAERLVRWCRRKPVTAGLYASLVLLMIVSTVAVTIHLQGTSERKLQEQWTALRQELNRLDGYSRNDVVESLLAGIAELGAVEGERARQQHRDALASLWQRQLEAASRLTNEAVAELESGLTELERRSIDTVSLRTALTQRQAQWQTELSLQPPFDPWPVELNGHLESHVETLQLAESAVSQSQSLPGGETIWLSPVASGDTCELEVLFAKDWNGAAKHGVLLSAQAGQAYEFSIRPAGDASPTSYLMEIRRGETLLVRQAARLSTAQPLKIWARREQLKLSMQVNDNPAVDFDDAFTLLAGADDAFGLVAPNDAEIVRLRARRKMLPAKASPLETADGSFAEGDFSSALQDYENLATRAGGSAELLYKQGLCQSALRRESQAVGLWREAMRSNDSVWATRAACQLWHYFVAHNQMQQAEQVLTEVRGLRFEDAASLVPAPVREQILTAYRLNSAGFANVLRFDPDRVLKAKRVVEVEQRLLPSGHPSAGSLFALAQIYEDVGERQLAMDTFADLFRLPTVAGIGFYFQHQVRLMRLNEDYDGAENTLSKYLTQCDLDSRRWLQWERVRLLAARAKWEPALAHYQQQFGEVSHEEMVLPAEMTLAEGLLHQKTGDADAAAEIWTAAVPDLRRTMSNASGSEMLNFLAMAAICGHLRVEDVDLLITQFAKGDDSKASILASGLPRSTLHNVMQAGWTSPRGLALAEQFAFDQVSRRDRIRLCVCLMGATYWELGALDSDPTENQRELAWELAEKFFDATVSTNEIQNADLAKLLAAWKDAFRTGPAAWSLVKKQLAPALRGPVAYTLGQRYLNHLKRPEVAKSFFEQARVDATETNDERLIKLLDSVDSP